MIYDSLRKQLDLEGQARRRSQNYEQDQRANDPFWGTSTEAVRSKPLGGPWNAFMEYVKQARDRGQGKRGYVDPLYAPEIPGALADGDLSQDQYVTNSLRSLKLALSDTEPLAALTRTTGRKFM